MIKHNGVNYPFRFDGRGGLKSSILDTDISDRVQQSIEQILLTRRGERIMNPSFGTNIHKLLFSNLERDNLLPLIRHEIIKELEVQEKRIEIIDVQMTLMENQVILAIIDYHIPQFDKDDRTTIEIGGVIDE